MWATKGGGSNAHATLWPIDNKLENDTLAM